MLHLRNCACGHCFLLPSCHNIGGDLPPSASFLPHCQPRPFPFPLRRKGSPLRCAVLCCTSAAPPFFLPTLPLPCPPPSPDNPVAFAGPHAHAQFNSLLCTAWLLPVVQRPTTSEREVLYKRAHVRVCVHACTHAGMHLHCACLHTRRPPCTHTGMCVGTCMHVCARAWLGVGVGVGVRVA